MANLSPIPDGLTDEQVLMCTDIMSTGFSGAESGGIRIGDTVVVFALGPIGLCAVAGAKLMGRSTRNVKQPFRRAPVTGVLLAANAAFHKLLPVQELLNGMQVHRCSLLQGQDLRPSLLEGHDPHGAEAGSHDVLHRELNHGNRQVALAYKADGHVQAGALR